MEICLIVILSKTQMMKRVVFLILFFGILTIGCQSARKTSGTSTTSEVSTDERDGSSYEKAIIVKSIDAEYEWLRQNCPGCKFLQQALRQNKGMHYDVLTVQLTDGSKKEFYFDINSFFGKF